MSKRTLSRAALDNRANQLNPQHAAFHSSRGQAPPPAAMPQAPAATPASPDDDPPVVNGTSKK